MFKLSNTKILSFILLSSLFFSYTWIYSFYISTRNVDFEKYYDYINYFTGVNVDIDFGQGVIYYFLIAKRLISKLDLVNLSNTELLVGAAVQEINFIFFLFGLFGLFLFLKSKNYETETILATLILLIYFPQTIYLRAVMKPEIIAFAFVPWILFFIEKYLLDQDVKKLFYAIPFFALVINSKASVAGMLCIYLIFAYFEILKKINLKNFVILSISIIFIISFLQFESYSITGNRIIDRPYDSEYDYKANPKILLNINLYEIVKHPFFSLNKNGETYHSKSVINILLLDTFGDYFNQIFDDEVNYFAKHRKNIFTNNSEVTFSETRQINYKGIFNQYLINNLNHIRKLISLMFSVIFYFSILIFSYRDKPNRKYYQHLLLQLRAKLGTS